MNITVYCGASVGNNPTHQQATIELGKWIAQNNHTLVYGGGSAGLMGLIADTVLDHGGKVIGIMPTFLQEREIAHKRLTQLITVESMTERKLKMYELGEAYIALAGGLGTLEEISEMISWARIGKNDHPCIFFNSDNFYQPLQQFLRHMVNQGFLTQGDFEKTLFTTETAEITHFIQYYVPPEIRRY